MYDPPLLVFVGELYVVSDRHLQGPYEDIFPSEESDDSRGVPRGEAKHVRSGRTTFDTAACRVSHITVCLPPCTRAFVPARIESVEAISGSQLNRTSCIVSSLFPRSEPLLDQRLKPLPRTQDTVVRYYPYYLPILHRCPPQVARTDGSEHHTSADEIDYIVDDLEGHPGYFRREMVCVTLEHDTVDGATGTETMAWMYFLADKSQMKVRL